MQATSIGIQFSSSMMRSASLRVAAFPTSSRQQAVSLSELLSSMNRRNWFYGIELRLQGSTLLPTLPSPPPGWGSPAGLKTRACADREVRLVRRRAARVVAAEARAEASLDRWV